MISIAKLSSFDTHVSVDVCRFLDYVFAMKSLLLSFP